MIAGNAASSPHGDRFSRVTRLRDGDTAAIHDQSAAACELANRRFAVAPVRAGTFQK
ncbi:protein of unknown function [Burkholderia multivorans]